MLMKEDEIKKYLDNVITHWRSRKKKYEDMIEKEPDVCTDMTKQFEEILMASCYIDAYQRVRVSLFGELLLNI